jgi:hypothetical protein
MNIPIANIKIARYMIEFSPFKSNNRPTAGLEIKTTTAYTIKKKLAASAKFISFAYTVRKDTMLE